MDKFISCEFNIHTTCVGLYFPDGSMISIDCTVLYLALEDNHRRLQGRLYRMFGIHVEQMEPSKVQRQWESAMER